MATLQEILEQDMGLGATVKTASAQVNEGDELDRLAVALGLDFGKTAEEDKHEDEESEEKEEKEEKQASDFSGSLFNRMFPEDEILSKTAEEQEKIAFEQNLGARSFDYYADRFDRRIEKLAADMLTGGATISAPTAADPEGNVHKDPTIPQATKDNRPENAGNRIDPTPQITDEVTGRNESKTVGHVEQKHAAIMDAALRKQWLLSQLD